MRQTASNLRPMQGRQVATTACSVKHGAGPVKDRLRRPQAASSLTGPPPHFATGWWCGGDQSLPCTGLALAHKYIDLGTNQRLDTEVVAGDHQLGAGRVFTAEGGHFR